MKGEGRKANPCGSHDTHHCWWHQLQNCPGEEIATSMIGRLLPIANVGRIMKQILPPNGKISKEAKETMQECVSEFISFVTGEASEKCHKEKRKTVNGDDICWALNALGFDDYVEPMRSLQVLHYASIESWRTAVDCFATAAPLEDLAVSLAVPGIKTEEAPRNECSTAQRVDPALDPFHRTACRCQLANVAGLVSQSGACSAAGEGCSIDRGWLGCSKSRRIE
ncbi:hypothetical protein ZIOFF_063943 [Zingiber officinale]|uniref:NFY protein n=1 Tax=Zingiber officinale TaxID=94328 RepID=A0A8J5F742_ZINOF|nr:hypothetical protein ZIOFF_063943 [Zingiber officinale]WLQ69703.1 NFY protein [Zingiber officinale]